MDIVDQIMDYESGSMADDEAIKFFQELINSGTAWELQGSYGRTARELIVAGHCRMPIKPEPDTY